MLSQSPPGSGSVLWLSLALAGEPQHGLALGTAVKYQPGFAHFAYADPQAVQGGVLTLGYPGSFDKLNPFSLKGRAPLLLSTLVFESLTDRSLDEPFAAYGLLADTIQVADDEMSVTYHLHPRARFADGQPMRFTITLDQADFQRIVEPYLDNLRKLGVQAIMKVVGDSVSERLLRTFDFDMVVAVFAQSQSPGNEQRDVWHSEGADQEGSNNLIGIKHPAVDALVEAIITANSRKELVTAVHALDRILWHEHYVVPHWFLDRHLLTYWNKLMYPKTIPLYYEPLTYLLFWWLDPVKEGALAAARTANRPVTR